MNKDVEEYLSSSSIRDTKGALHKEFLYVINLGKISEEGFAAIHL
jgi:hypothetical protein